MKKTLSMTTGTNMTIDEIIQKLTMIKKEHGNLKVKTGSSSTVTGVYFDRNQWGVDGPHVQLATRWDLDDCP